jgi:predicted transcriptional regulator
VNRFSDCILLSFYPEHAERIYLGEKRAELRKSFPGSAKIIFIYETAPVSALTGAFIVKEAIKTSVDQAIAIAIAAGVGASRAEKYYAGREYGWIIKIGLAVKFSRTFQLAELKFKNHYFSVPQTFSYLSRTEGMTQELLSAFQKESEAAVRLRPLSSENLAVFEKLVLLEVGNAYEDIDQDFLTQILDEKVVLRSAFSTRAKHVLEVVWGDQLMGFTVLTAKSYGAWKSGPTILLPGYRGLGFGQTIRKRIEEFCIERGAIGIYCTCAESQSATVSYLVNYGMRFQARLNEHLSRGRAELVFMKKLSKTKPSRIVSKVGRSSVAKKGFIIRVKSDDRKLKLVLQFFLRQMPRWYFKPPPNLGKALQESLLSHELGVSQYSAKNRSLYAFLDKRGYPFIAALLTEKRSGMIKINLVASGGSRINIKQLLSRALVDRGPCRRVYLTVPTKEPSAVGALSELGFGFEGILQDPFGTGVDHICYGYCHQKKGRISGAP